jgi:NAD(P)-dependent dehydrogenase (short-subunit alcohol dehydrogenase family)
VLIAQAKPLYRHDDFGVDLDDTVYALDSTTIDLCLSLFPWARFRSTKAAVLGLTRSLAMDLGSKGITANAICPGPIYTMMLKNTHQN